LSNESDYDLNYEVEMKHARLSKAYCAMIYIQCIYTQKNTIVDMLETSMPAKISTATLTTKVA
jgi:hypothetical protein